MGMRHETWKGRKVTQIAGSTKDIKNIGFKHCSKCYIAHLYIGMPVVWDNISLIKLGV